MAEELQNSTRSHEADSLDRAVSLTQIPGGEVVVEVGEEILHLRHTEGMRLSELLKGIRWSW